MKKEDQIRALLSGRAFAYATEILGVSHMASHSYSEVFSVTRAEIDSYVALHGIPAGMFSTSDDGAEGIHCVRAGGNWAVYWQDRDGRCEQQHFTEERLALREVTNWVLRTSGTGVGLEAPNQPPQTTPGSCAPLRV